MWNDCGGANRGGNRVSILARYARFRRIVRSSEIIVTQMALNDFLRSRATCNLCIIMAIIINFIITFPSKRCHIPYARSIPRVYVIVRNIMEIFFEINSNYDPICPRMQRSGFELGSEICREWTRTGLRTILVSKVQFVGEREKRRDGGGGEKRERKGRKERVRPSHITAAHGDLWCDENYCRC